LKLPSKIKSLILKSESGIVLANHRHASKKIKASHNGHLPIVFKQSYPVRTEKKNNNLLLTKHKT